jgi:hypothetical protein
MSRADWCFWADSPYRKKECFETIEVHPDVNWEIFAGRNTSGVFVVIIPKFGTP